MAFTAPGDLFLVTAFGSVFGQRIMLTHNYELTTVNMNVLVSDIETSIIKQVRGGAGGTNVLEGAYLALLPADYTLDFWQAQIIGPNRFVPVTVNRGTVGTHASGTEASNQAAVITLRTDKAGRNQVSNKHIGPIPQGATVQNNGLVQAAYDALLTTLKTGLLSTLTDVNYGASWRPVINHHTKPIISSDPLTSGLNGTTLRTMRRRTVGLGI